MKQIEITKDIKQELWRLFDAGHTFSNLTIRGHAIPAEAVKKQHELWAAFRSRNPKRTKHEIQTKRASA